MDMDDGARLWLFKYAHQNYWRVPSWYSMKDLIQDGFMTYYRVTRRYSHVKKRGHMMSLFKVCFINHIHDLSKTKTRYCEVELTDNVMSTMVDDGCEAMSSLIMSTPAPVQGLIRAMMTDDGQKKLRKPYRVGRRGRETTNARWCRIAGVSSRNTDLPKLVKKSINGETNENVDNETVPL